MINLNEKEKETILEFSNNYREIHKEILDVEKKINDLQGQSKFLIEKLEFFRSSEVDFLKDLSEKYGEGELNLIDFSWLPLSEKI
jgi:hypothetical protein